MLYQAFHHRWLRIAVALIGALIGAIAVNVFIVPFNLYSGGLMGISQLIRTGLKVWFGIEFSGIDLAGILYLTLNIPILLYARNIVGKHIFRGTIVGTIAYSVFFAIVPVPTTPIVSDMLTSVLIGGILSGIGTGIVLTCGCSGGSLDILGLCFQKQGKRITVGRFNIFFNGALYTVCMILFSIETAIYSIIYIACYSMCLDRFHQQNINVQVSILTRTSKQEISDYIINRLGRGVSQWQAIGGYSGAPAWMLFACVSKYEVERLRRAVRGIDEHAFIVVHEGVRVDGNFPKKIDSDNDDTPIHIKSVKKVHKEKPKDKASENERSLTDEPIKPVSDPVQP